MRLTLYSKPECTLCDELKAHLAALQPQMGFDMIECNIEEDAELFERFRYLIPVLDIEGGSVLYPPHDWDRLVGELERVNNNNSA